MLVHWWNADVEEGTEVRLGVLADAPPPEDVFPDARRVPYADVSAAQHALACGLVDVVCIPDAEATGWRLLR